MLKILCPTCNHYKVSWHRTILGADWGRWPDVYPVRNYSIDSLFGWTMKKKYRPYNEYDGKYVLLYFTPR